MVSWRGFLVQTHDVLGVTFQNWMVIAAVIVIAALIWSAVHK
jgi:hypothetical protein